MEFIIILKIINTIW